MRHLYTLCLAIGFIAAGLLLAGGSGSAAAPPPVTFNKDVAPIIFKNCTSCHRPNQVAPMSFLSYKDVRPWAKSIREMVVERRMPPWFADPHFGDFSNDRRLSQKEIDTISAWVEGGAQEGNPKDLPRVPAFLQEGWSIGKPDVVLSMTEEFSVPSEGVVDYKYFIVPTNFTDDKYVQFAEIKRGNPSLVHHVIVSVREPSQENVAAGQVRSGTERLDPESNTAAREGGGQANRNPDGMLVGWAPGMSPLMLKPGVAKLVKKGSVLVFQMHYTTNGQAGKDRTGVGLIFSKDPVEKRFITMGAAARNLVIPAGEPKYESRSTFTFNQDSHIWGFMPHMHLRGRDFEYKLVLPDGTSKVVLSVPKYDFNWQLNYWLKEPLAAPKGSKLECLAHHDNSVGNKFNPDATKEVRWGPQTWEEMMIGWFDYTIDSQDLRVTTASNR